MTFLLMFWKPIAAVLLVLALVGGAAYAKHSYDDGKREEGRAEVRAEWKIDTDRRIAATTALTMLWNSKRQEAENAIDQRDKARAERAADAQKRARTLPPAVAAVVVPAAAVGVLRHALDATGPAPTAGPAGAAAATPAPPAASADSPSTVGLLVAWGLSAIDAYETCRDRVAGWQAFYSSLQASQGAPP